MGGLRTAIAYMGRNEKSRYNLILNHNPFDLIK